MNVLLSTGLWESSIGTDKITCIYGAGKRALGIYFHHLYEDSFKYIENIIFTIIVKNSFTQRSKKEKNLKSWIHIASTALILYPSKSSFSLILFSNKKFNSNMLPKVNTEQGLIYKACICIFRISVYLR